MRRFLILLYLLPILIFTLTGCVIQGDRQLKPAQVYLMENENTLPTQTATITIPINDPVSTPTPVFSDEVLEIIQALSCGEVFCQTEWIGWLARPFDYPDRERIDLTYPYASKGDGSLDIHHGVEFPNPYGTLVRAAANGEVIFAGMDDQIVLGPYTNFYGNVVILRHIDLFNGEDLYSVYGHLSTINVAEGTIVEVGDILGEVGTSGVAIGSHLHFEVRYGLNDYDHTTNPVLWFSPLEIQINQRSGVLAGLISDRYGDQVPEASVTLEKLDDEGIAEKTYYFKTYAVDGTNPHAALKENFTFPDLPPGDYRLTYYSVRLYELFFTLEPGMLGYVSLKVN